MTAGPTRGSLRELAVSVHLPILATQTGVAMLIPTLPVWLRQEGLDYTTVTLVLAAPGIGGLLTNVPAGRLIQRFGDRRVLLGAVVMMATGIGLLAARPPTLGLVAAQALTGAGGVLLILAQQTQVLRRAPAEVRGRALSWVGGSLRVAFLVGPLLGGLIAEAAGFRSAFAVAALVTLSAVVPVLLGTEPADAPRTDDDGRRSPGPGFREVAVAHAGALLAAGIGQLGAIALRFGRQVILPLYGESIGLDTATIGAIVSLSAFLDLALFPSSGYLMDRHGRLFAIVPAFAVMSAAMLALPLVGGTTGLVLAGVLFGIGNGMGAGTMHTDGTYLAPATGAAQFLAALGLLRDAGRIGGPLLVGVVADRVDLDWSATGLAIIGLGTVAVFVLVVGETRPLPAGDAGRSSAAP